MLPKPILFFIHHRSSAKVAGICLRDSEATQSFAVCCSLCRRLQNACWIAEAFNGQHHLAQGFHTFGEALGSRPGLAEVCFDGQLRDSAIIDSRWPEPELGNDMESGSMSEVRVFSALRQGSMERQRKAR